MRTPRPSSLKERCLMASASKDTGDVAQAERLVGEALRTRKWTEEALSDLTAAVELCAVILVEEYGARQIQGDSK